MLNIDMKKIVLTLTIVLVFLIGAQNIEVAKANPIDRPLVPDMQISFPLISTGGYVNSTVEFEVYVNMFIESPALNSVSYSLDGQTSVNLENLEVTSYYDYGPEKIDFKKYKANILLENLSEGHHTLVANASDMSASRDFTVNSHYQVTMLNILSPTNKIYFETVPLLFTINAEIANAHYYLYNGSELVSEKSLSGNTTLENLSDGSYNMHVFVTTKYGQAAETIHFSVSKNSQVENLPVIIGATALLIFSIAIGLLVYRKKRRR
jgi:hypothetical protein